MIACWAVGQRCGPRSLNIVECRNCNRIGAILQCDFNCRCQFGIHAHFGNEGPDAGLVNLPDSFRHTIDTHEEYCRVRARPNNSPGASIPFIPGIRISRMTTLGRMRLAFSMASVPLAASPQIIQSSLSTNSLRTSRRNASLSSATNIRSLQCAVAHPFASCS